MVKKRLLAISITSAVDGKVRFTYPLRGDGVVHEVDQSDIYLPIGEVAKLPEYALSKAVAFPF